jgi:hypothetical protein
MQVGAIRVVGGGGGGRGLDVAAESAVAAADVELIVVLIPCRWAVETVMVTRAR